MSGGYRSGLADTLRHGLWAVLTTIPRARTAQLAGDAG
jgi:hypothetical protein